MSGHRKDRAIFELETTLELIRAHEKQKLRHLDTM